MNLANKLSIFRLLLVPFIVGCLLYYAPDREALRWVAVGLFVLGMLTDALDGYIARRQHQETPLGALLDPIADKCLILGTLISCSVIRGLPPSMRIPAWFNLTVISRDALVVAGSLIVFLTQGTWHVRTSRLGKWATFGQMLVVPTVLLGLPGRDPLLLAVAAVTVISAVAYVRMGAKVLR